MLDASTLVAAGTVAGSLTAIGGVATFVAKLVRAPLEALVERLKIEVDNLGEDVTHNRANADAKVQALDIRVAEAARDISALKQADVEHAAAIRHIEATMASGFATLKERLDEVLAELRDARRG